jgi:hypothetical protein
VDLIGGIGKILGVPWAFLLRIAASLIGLCALGMMFTQMTPLLNGAGALGWLGLSDPAEALKAAHGWIIFREDVFTWVAVGGILLGVVTASTRSRGGAVAVVGIGLALETGDLVSLWPIGVLFLAWLVARIHSSVTWRRDRMLPGFAHDWLNTALAELPAAVFYIPAAPFRWIVNPREFRL